MNKLHKFKKLLIGGIFTLTLVTAVACSSAVDRTAGAGSAIATDGTLGQQIAATNTIDTAVVAPENTKPPVEADVAVLPDVPATATDVPASPTEQSSPTAESIQAAFNGEEDDKPKGDAFPEVVEPEVATLTPAEIVEAQGIHLADLYERTVQSVVFIVSTTAQGVGSGSGFVWDTEGHIVTNYHVVQNASSLTVKFFNGREYRADVVAFDPDADLAVIKLIDPEHELVPIAIGNSSDLRPGEMAIALGNPFGEEFTMTTGIVSAVSRTLNSGFSSYSIPSVVQTDAAINPGNSGGPLLDKNGAVIGVNTQIRSESRQNSGVGFAVPVDLVKRVVPSLINFGHHTYSLMGITGVEVDITKRESANLPGDVVGAMVMSVSPGGPADTAGIRGDSGERANNGALIRGLENWDGDVIVSINSIPMRSMDDLIGYLALNTAPDQEIEIGIFRDGIEISVSMKLGSRPSIS
jgi:2-alkenal reductase